MALEDYNSLLIENLEQLKAAGELADGESAREYLGKLADEGFDDEILSTARKAVDADEFDQLAQWCTARLEEMRGEINPFDDFDFDVDDAFLDVEDTGFREPSEVAQNIDADELLGDLGDFNANPAFEVVDDVSLKDDEDDEDARPHVLSGRFNLVSQEAIETDKKQRLSFVESLDLAAKQTGIEDLERQTRPNVAPDLHGIRNAVDSAVDARRPAPRLPATDVSGEIAISALELSESDQPSGGPFRGGAAIDDPPTRELQVPDSESSFELESSQGFDFGFHDDEEDEVAPDDNFDFDLGLSNPEERSSANDASQTKPVPDEPTADRHRKLTPLGQVPAASRDPDDMFFELAEALAADSSVDEVHYRGEPLKSAHAATTNPFGHDMPTGTGHMPLNGAAGGDAAKSLVHTNMNAILLEARRLRACGELGAALDIARKVLSRDPSEDAEALVLQIEDELEEEHLEKLGPLEQRPTLSVAMGELSELSLDHRAGYVMSQVDGAMTYDDLLEVSGMGRLETLAVFCDLLERGVISS